MPQMPPSRRQMLAGMGALATTGLPLLGATGCAAPSASGAGRTPVRYWHLFGGGDGVNMQAMLRDYRSEHPGVHLESATLEWGAPYYTKLGMAGAGSRAPEVAAMHLTRLPGFAPGRLLDPFDLDLLAGHGITNEDFPQDIWQRGTVDGKQYAIPLDTHPMVLYYHTEVCEKAGLLDADGKLKPLYTPDDFTAALRAAKKVTGHPGAVFETLGSDTVGAWRLFVTFYSQTGGTVLDPTAQRITIDDDKALRVLEYLRMIVDEGLAVRRVDANAVVGTFNSGNHAFFLHGEWEVSSFRTTKLPFSMTRIPGLFGRPTTQADCHCFVLPHQADRGGDSNRAAHEFVAWMLKHTVDWAKGGHVPAYLPTLEKPAYLALEPQSEYRSVIDDVVLDPPAWFAGSASRMWIELGAVLSGVLTGSRTPRAGLAECKDRLQKLLDTPNPFGGAA